MTLYSDKVPENIINAKMGRDFQNLAKYFTGENNPALDGCYSYDTQIYDGNNHLIAICNLAGDGHDFTKEECHIAEALSACADFIGKYNEALEKIIFGETE